MAIQSNVIVIEEQLQLYRTFKATGYTDIPNVKSSAHCETFTIWN